MTAIVYLIPFIFVSTYAQERLKDIPLSPDYCKNGGVFVNGECVCTLRYEGKQCEQERCLNGGRRHKANGQGECVCTLRYEGKQCEQERCLNGGRRHKANGQVRCHCPFGLSGDRCEKVTYCEPGKG
ncbi:unnamed protein product [Strongylus vulgaris]|uniref:EGF-like domain-containing protein n=1 Tax=Strongylus vulgaris TaxID=40348 RepID=A0A3P7LC59_STRVU|nr:unnamed protein product [Strongylus vulgaris]